MIIQQKIYNLISKSPLIIHYEMYYLTSAILLVEKHT